MIGLACKAGKVSSGGMAAKNSLLRKGFSFDFEPGHFRKNQGQLVSSCQKRHIPWLMLGIRSFGAHVARIALTINDRGFAHAILKALMNYRLMKLKIWGWSNGKNKSSRACQKTEYAE